jgi:hypothetical protein
MATAKAGSAPTPDIAGQDDDLEESAVAAVWSVCSNKKFHT